MTKFTSILVANRGEIACRVIRTAKAQGYRTIAVYSDADAGAPHVKMADAAVHIGPSPVNQSYLVQANILAAAKSSGAEAIHPGYGFLSENASFAKACEDDGLIFIGPSADAIHLMGNKAEAKRRMIAAGVPCVPGYEGEDQNDAALLSEGAKIKLPLMVKAAAGGGGRGMRMVHRNDELANAIDLARAEAASAFGSDELILEKAIIRPRHVEIQVFGDSHGTLCIFLNVTARCSGVIKKSSKRRPRRVSTLEMRAAMRSALSIDYRGAGTVEFLLDELSQFYFLEMNTRLQVEHPVTELITGLDLVALQLRVAQGEPLGFTQSEVRLNGHAIEARLYTEDPAQNFLPTSGPVEFWSPPTGVGVRVDSGICSGQEISPFYDPMVAKIIASGPNREIARLRLIEGLKNTVLFGTRHNRDFLVACLEKDCFAAGHATTAFIEEEFIDSELADLQPSFTDSAVAAVLELTLEHQSLYANSILVARQLRDWSSASPLVSRKLYIHGEQIHDLSITALGAERYRVFDTDNATVIELSSVLEDAAQVSIDGELHTIRYLSPEDGKLYLSIGGRATTYLDQIRLTGAQDDAAGSGKITAPMHGLLLEMRITAGDRVEEGQTLAVLEAMKMHYEIVADTAGEIIEVLAVAGQQVAADDLLINIDIVENS